MNDSNIGGGSGGTGGRGDGGSWLNPYPPGGGGGGSTIPGGAGGAGGMGGYGSTPQPPPKPMFSFNRFIVEPYVSDRTVKTASTGRTEFARIEQKIAVKGLRLLVDMVLDSSVGVSSSVAIDGCSQSTSQSGPMTIKAGSTIFIREEFLHTAAWAKVTFESNYLGKFMLVEKQYIEFIQPI